MSVQSSFSFRRGDLFSIALVVLLALASAAAFLPRNDASQNAVVQVFQNGSLIRELPLREDAQLEIAGEFTNLLTIRSGKAAIEESDCPGADCVHSGWIGQPGRSIVCLPNRVEIRISGSSDVDFVVG